MLLFTNDDMPYGSGGADTADAACQRTLSRAADMGGSGMQIELWHLEPLPSFDIDVFYGEMLTRNLESYAKHVSERVVDVILKDDTVSEASEVAQRTIFDHMVDASGPDGAIAEAQGRWVVKRTLKRINFVIGDGVASVASSASASAATPSAQLFSMKAYALLRPAEIPTAKKVDARTNEALRTETNYLCPSSGASLQRHQVSTYFLFGKNDRAAISPAEVDAIKRARAPCQVRLLGFKPAACIKPHHQLRNPTFIYPDDEMHQGSLLALSALHARMLARDVVAICGVKVHARTPERLGAMIAQRECADEHGRQTEPSGFQIVFLPFADDIRQIQDVYFDREQATEEQQEMAEALIQHAKVRSFDPSCFENPKLQKHYAALQALALRKDELDWHEDFDDDVRADHEGLAAQAEPLARALADRLPEKVDPPPKGSKKRKATAAPIDEKVRKQQRMDFLQMEEEGTLDKQSVPRLKAFLKSQGLPLSGKKADLVTRARGTLKTGK